MNTLKEITLPIQGEALSNQPKPNSRAQWFIERKEIRRTMKNKLMLAGLIVTILAVVPLIWIYVNHLDYLSKTMHETDEWAVIADSRGDIIAVETTSGEIWNTLKSLYQNRTAMWIGGFIELYNNKWGFRFKPDTIVVAQNTAEGAQSDIQGINADLDYWMNGWARETYVLADVVDIHE